jgi:hypothetical protein
MSGNIRNVCLLSSVVLGSWIAVRALAASPEPVLDDPPISMAIPPTAARRELRDDGLAETIHRFATLAPGSVRSPLASR